MGKKILLADDSITIQKVIELTFSDEDFEVVTVGNGRLAIERLPEARPDLVLCDIIMPEKDGYEVCDFIKKNPALSHIPVLLLTGAFEPFDQEKAARVGCDGFLAKPFEPQTLIAKVKELLARAKPATTAAVAAPSPTPPALSAPAPAISPAAAPPWANAMPTPPPAPAPAPPPPPTTFSPAPVPVAAPPRPPAPLPEPEAEPDDFAPGGMFGAPIDLASYESGQDVGTQKSPVYRGGGDYESPQSSSSTPGPLDELYDDDGYAAGGDDLMPLSADEAESVSSAEREPEPAPWAQPTVEVPLEMRAQAGVESAQQNAADGFEEVFEEESIAPPTRETVSAPAPAPASSPSAPSPAAPATAREGFGWAREADIPAGTPDSSFRDIAPAEQEDKTSITRSVAGEVQVPVDMVEKIAQRVVAQISEKVIREIAWEVIPDLAEALIKREIDRLKAELQQT